MRLWIWYFAELEWSLFEMLLPFSPHFFLSYLMILVFSVRSIVKDSYSYFLIQQLLRKILNPSLNSIKLSFLRSFELTSLMNFEWYVSRSSNSSSLVLSHLKRGLEGFTDMEDTEDSCSHWNHYHYNLLRIWTIQNHEECTVIDMLLRTDHLQKEPLVFSNSLF
jgi:hypothetical protein